jgi:glycosyltransferase involved in cell wall biosynthesis
MDCDGGSTDNTIHNFFNTKTKTPKRVIVATPGTTGKGNVFKLLFKYAKLSKAKTALVNDSDLRSINPKWVKLQLDSIEKHGYDYATPLYSRYKYDGTITKHICYPIIYGLFCRNIRQPIGGDFAFSGRLANHWLKCKWPVNAKLFGIDIFMTTNAILADYKICQVNLKSKVHDVKDPAKTLSPMFRQVISTLFKIIIENPKKLKNLHKVKEIPKLGEKNLGKPQQFSIDNEATKQRFVRGFTNRKEVIKKCLSKEDFTKLRTMVQYSNIYIPPEWWAKIVYDYILAYKKYENKSSTILKSFIPLWFGRIYTFVNQTKNMTTAKAELLVKKQAQEFFKQRSYLLSRL